MLNPYESPSHTELTNGPSTASLSVRNLFSDGAAGVLVGATYASLGVAIMTTACAGLMLSASAAWSNFEQLLFAFVAGAFLGAALGAVLGGVAGGILGGLFRLLQWQKSLSFFWTAVAVGSLLGSMLGVAGGMLLSKLGNSAGADPTSLIWCPLGAVLGGMLGSLSGRKWVQMVGGPLMSLPWGNVR